MRLHIFDGHLIRIAVVALARGLAAVSEMIEHGDGVGATAPKHFMVADRHLGVLFAALLDGARHACFVLGGNGLHARLEADG